MRKSLVLATILVLVCSAAAFAVVPDPTRSVWGILPPALCQFRFNATGTLDTMTLLVTLRDAFDVPVAGCTTTAEVGAPSIVAADCEGVHTGVSNAGGVVSFYFKCVGGRGDAKLLVTARCVGDAAICDPSFTFTSPDMNASMEVVGSSTKIDDLGHWAAGLFYPPYVQESDFDCDGPGGGAADVVDLGLWASGLGTNCSMCPPGP